MTITTSAGCIERLGEQIERERQGKLDGLARLRSRTEALVNKSSATQSAVWRTVLNTGLLATADLMEEKWKSITTRPGVDHAELVPCLSGMDKRVMALLGLKLCIDTIARYGRAPIPSLCVSIGATVHQEARMCWYQEQNPRLYEVISQRRFHRGSTAWHKERSMTFSMNEANIQWEPWKSTSRARVGLWIVGCIIEATGWFSREVKCKGYKNRESILVATPTLGKLVQKIWRKANRLAYLKTPFIIPPPDWYWDAANTRYEGGYTDTEIYQKDPILHYKQTTEDVLGPVALEAINKIQRVAYQINPVVLRVAAWAKAEYYGQIGSGGPGSAFFYGEAKEIPGDFLNAEEDEEGLKEWKKAKARLYDFNAQVVSNNLRTDTIIMQAEDLQNDVFYFVWKYDYRGRLYPDQPLFNPQGIDFVRALFYFAEEGPVNRDWLAFQVATTYGLDKATLTERLQWVKENRELISAIAADPEGTVPLWESADEPWQFMAACCEYHACCIALTKTTSGLPVGIDATCSGLQHLSALTRDRTAAALVNVVPQDFVADGYRTVAEVAQPLLPERVRPWITRKVTKRTVMTTPYGVTRHSARGYIRAQLREDERDLSEEGLLTRITAAIFDEAMPSVFAGPVAVMKWIQKSSAAAIKGKEQLTWKSPSGFKVIQRFMQRDLINVRTMLMGTTRFSMLVSDGDTDKVDEAHHKAASAPNLVHSCDAALLHFVLSDWDRPIYTVHDCVQGRSCDMEELASKVRTHFCEMYRGRDVLAAWARDVGVEPNPDLIVGDLDIEEVLDSQYFFC